MEYRIDVTVFAHDVHLILCQLFCWADDISISEGNQRIWITHLHTEKPQTGGIIIFEMCFHFAKFEVIGTQCNPI